MEAAINKHRLLSLLLLAPLLALVLAPAAGAAPAALRAQTAPLTFAVIGDYGTDNSAEAAVAALVAGWDPAFIVTTGDDYYNTAGGEGTAKYDESTGAYYCAFLRDITTTGGRCPTGQADVNRFFPSMGNHDYSDATPGPDTYLAYFALPGAGFANTSNNERYYDFVWGPLHFFILNSNSVEPDGAAANSAQAVWLQTQLAASTSAWNLVVFHHPPYSSGSHGNSAWMQWPFAAWGADAILSGHDHAYERIARDGIVYFVNGLGGASRYGFGVPVEGSQARYNADWGAMRVTATESTLDFEFVSLAGQVQDTYHLPAAPTPTPTPTPAPIAYTVVSGDTLLGIAGNFGLSLDQLLAANNWTTPPPLMPNMVLVIPPPAASLAETAAPANGPATPTPVTGTVNYQVKPGDTLAGVAETLGVAISDIIANNDIGDANDLIPGTILAIPVGLAQEETGAAATLPTPIYPAPAPISPPDHSVILSDQALTLRWVTVALLPERAWYAVHLAYADPTLPPIETILTRNSSVRLDPNLRPPPGERTPELLWWVNVVRQEEDGRLIPLSPPSRVRHLTW